MARDTWYRLDNIGKFYSAQAGSSFQTVFRFSATLVDEVDASFLQGALEETVQAFPNFNVCLRSGMFWHYLEQSPEKPQVFQENLPICFGLHVHAKSVLFRVSYYRQRINFEISHIVSDGRGSLNFFKMLVSLYIQKRYGLEAVSFEYDGSDYQKAEDSFDKYYEKRKGSQTRKKDASSSKQKVYRLSGWRDKADVSYLEYHVSTQAIQDLARSYEVSVTALLAAVLICSIYREMPRREKHRAIRISIPVDLRQYFESTTTKNFFGLAYVSYVPQKDESLEEIASLMNDQLKLVTSPDSLKPRMNRMIALEKNPLLRGAPLFVKDFALECAAWLAARETTTTLSNLNRIAFDQKLVPYLHDVNVLTSTRGLNFTLCSFEDDLSIGISSAYSNLDLIKNFCRFFSQFGMEGQININKTSKEIAVDRLEVQLETSVKRLSGQMPSAEDEEVLLDNSEVSLGDVKILSQEVRVSLEGDESLSEERGQFLVGQEKERQVSQGSNKGLKERKR